MIQAETELAMANQSSVSSESQEKIEELTLEIDRIKNEMDHIRDESERNKRLADEYHAESIELDNERSMRTKAQTATDKISRDYDSLQEEYKHLQDTVEQKIQTIQNEARSMMEDQQRVLEQRDESHNRQLTTIKKQLTTIEEQTVTLESTNSTLESELVDVRKDKEKTVAKLERELDALRQEKIKSMELMKKKHDEWDQMISSQRTKYVQEIQNLKDNESRTMMAGIKDKAEMSSLVKEKEKEIIHLKARYEDLSKRGETMEERKAKEKLKDDLDRMNKQNVKFQGRVEFLEREQSQYEQKLNLQETQIKKMQTDAEIARSAMSKQDWDYQMKMSKERLDHDHKLRQINERVVELEQQVSKYQTQITDLKRSK